MAHGSTRLPVVLGLLASSSATLSCADMQLMRMDPAQSDELHFNITMYPAHDVILEADTIVLRTVGPCLLLITYQRYNLVLRHSYAAVTLHSPWALCLSTVHRTLLGSLRTLHT